jgi:hypothetical protein
VTGGAGITNYQWQFFFEGEWIDVFGGNGQNYTSDPLEIGTYTYRVVVTQDAGCEAVSDGETVTVVPNILITDQPLGEAMLCWRKCYPKRNCHWFTEYSLSMGGI